MDTARLYELINEVPRPPEDEIPPGVSVTELTQFTERTKIPVPSQMAEWLTITNGPCVGPGGLYGIKTIRAHLDIERCLDRHRDWKDRGWIPVGGDGCGNYYVLVTNKQYGEGVPVVFIQPSESPDSPSYIVASDLEHFLVSLLERELGDLSWPFDQQAVTRRDPAILKYEGVPLPWVA